MLKAYEKNLRAIEKQMRLLSYASQGAITYLDAHQLSTGERVEWFKFLKEIKGDENEVFEIS